MGRNEEKTNATRAKRKDTGRQRKIIRRNYKLNIYHENLIRLLFFHL
jgi:hypothetical protein